MRGPTLNDAPFRNSSFDSQSHAVSKDALGMVTSDCHDKLTRVFMFSFNTSKSIASNSSAVNTFCKLENPSEWWVFTSPIMIQSWCTWCNYDTKLFKIFGVNKFLVIAELIMNWLFHKECQCTASVAFSILSYDRKSSFM